MFLPDALLNHRRMSYNLLNYIRTSKLRSKLSLGDCPFLLDIGFETVHTCYRYPPVFDKLSALGVCQNSFFLFSCRPCDVCWHSSTGRISISSRGLWRCIWMSLRCILFDCVHSVLVDNLSTDGDYAAIFAHIIVSFVVVDIGLQSDHAMDEVRET